MTAVPGPKGRSESQPIPSPPTLSKPQTAKRDVQALLALPVKFVLSGNTILIESTPAIFQQLLRKAQTTQTRRASKNNCQNTPSLSQESTAIHDSSRTSSDSDSSNSASPSTAPTSPPTSVVHSENESFDKEDIPLFEPTPSRESSPKKRKWDNDDSDVKRVKSNDGQALRNGLTEEVVDAPKDNTLESQSLKAEPVVEPSHKSVENPDIKPEVVDKDAPSPESPKSTPSPNKRKAVVTLEEPASQRVKITAKDKPQKIEAKDTKNTPEATTATPPKVIKGVDGVVKKKEKPVKRRVLGIRNPHIMCYRNSVLQLLGSCDIFVQELTKHRQGGTCKVKGTCVACCLATFFTKHFREADQPITLNPAMRFINATKKALPDPFDIITSQEDAYEYLTALLSTIESQLTKDFPEEGKKSHPVYRSFNGCFPSVVRCPKCKHESPSNFESVSLVMEPITSRDPQEVILLQSKLDEYFKAEKVEYKCEKCDMPGLCAKKNTMSSPPEFLIINIARHKPVKVAWKRGSKVMNGIAFHETLEMPIIVDGIKKGAAKYQLQSVVAHSGHSMTSGHYISYVFQPDATWARCNDETVTQVAWSKVKTCDSGKFQACLFGYRRVA